MVKHQRHIIYIINPISGTRTKKDLQSYIEQETAARKIPFKIFPSVADGDYHFLNDYIRQHHVTDIVIAGGDGTVSQAIGSLMHHPVNFGIIPCGSGNGLALAAGIPKKTEKALEIIFSGEAQETDGFRVNEQFACMLCGLGFDAKVAHDFAKQSKRGLSTYVKQVLKNFFGAKAHRFEITVQNHKVELEAFLFCIANSNQFGNKVTIAPKASLSDGLLDIVIIPKQNKVSVLWQTLRQLRGRKKLQDGLQPQKEKGLIYFQTEKISIKNVSGALMHLDGDPAETPDHLSIAVSKKAFRLLRP